jgi:hypothetical protein
MPFDTTFTLGPFLVDQHGRLTPDVNAAPAFRIVWRDRAIHVVMRESSPGQGSLTLRLTLGRIPSTAPAVALETRERAFATVRHLPSVLPAGWTMVLVADHRILLQAVTDLPLPVSASGLVSELTVFLLAVDPYLTLLEETGIGFPVAAAA